MLGRNKGNTGQELMNMPKPAGDSEGAISIIAAGMTIIGDCKTDGTVRIEGRLEGTIRAGKSVVVGRGGEVVGDILTQDAVVSGHVHGNIVAESRLELQATSDIEGEIRSRRVKLDEGAKFNGELHIEEATSVAKKPAREPSAPAPAPVKGKISDAGMAPSKSPAAD